MESQQLFIFHRGKEYGPFTALEVRKLAVSGKLPREALVRENRAYRWTRAENVGGLSFPVIPVRPIAPPASKKRIRFEPTPPPVFMRSRSA